MELLLTTLWRNTLVVTRVAASNSGWLYTVDDVSVAEAVCVGVCACSQVLLVPAVLLPNPAVLHLLRHDGGGRLSQRSASGCHLLCLLLHLVPVHRLPHPPPGAHIPLSRAFMQSEASSFNMRLFQGSLL